MSKVSIKSKLCVRLALGSQLLLKQIETNISSTPAPPNSADSNANKIQSQREQKVYVFFSDFPN